MKPILSALGLIRQRTPAIIKQRGEFVGRLRVGDAAYVSRMGAGSAGTVNRTHPATIEPALNDATNPAVLFGQGVFATTSGNSVRAVLTSDTTTPSTLYGVTVRPFPFQASSGTNFGATPFGGEIPPAGAIDVLRSGYIMVLLANFAAANAVKGGQAYIWSAATSGLHIQGGWESAASGGNTILINGATFNGPCDANGIVELCFNV